MIAAALALTLFVVEGEPQKLVRYSAGKTTTIALPAQPRDVAVSKDGTVFVSFPKTNTILAYTENLQPLYPIAVNSPFALTMSSSGDLYAASVGDRKIYGYHREQTTPFFAAVPGGYGLQGDLVVAKDGSLYIDQADDFGADVVHCIGQSCSAIGPNGKTSTAEEAEDDEDAVVTVGSASGGIVEIRDNLAIGMGRYLMWFTHRMKLLKKIDLGLGLGTDFFGAHNGTLYIPVQGRRGDAILSVAPNGRVRTLPIAVENPVGVTIAP